jgi:hypothetical protein
MVSSRFIAGTLAVVGGVLGYAWLSQAAPREKADTLEARVAALENELEAVKRGQVFAGLAQMSGALVKPDPVEIDALRGLAVARLLRWRMEYARYLGGGAHSVPTEEVLARTQLQSALAQLAWAEGRDKEARKYLEDAMGSADRLAAATKVSYDLGRTSLFDILEAQAVCGETRLAFHRAGGKLPRAGSSAKPWTLPAGEMPGPYPAYAVPRETEVSPSEESLVPPVTTR